MKLTFVCTGNICRSPMAEYMFKDILDDEETMEIDVTSAGVAAQTGRQPSPPAVEALKETGINSIAMHSARPVNDLDFKDGDLILTMTPAHLTRLPRSVQESPIETSVLKDYVGRSGGISDPYGGDLERYRSLRAELDPIIEDLYEKIVD